MDPNSDSIAHMVPKHETQVTDFLNKHQSYDGRNVIVAVFDTGCDPGSSGLQVTTEGKPKIIDVIDTTGSGDVDTSKVVHADEDGYIYSSLSDRKLKINTDWKNPSGEYHIGVKRVYDVFPKSLIRRLEEQRKKKFHELHCIHESELITAIEACNDTNTEKKKQLEIQLEQVLSLYKSYEDPGPVLDCVVFHDGEQWCSVIDTDQSCDLTNVMIMNDYRINRQYRPISDLDLMNFSVNIYENGNILSIVVTAGAHGTHVAGIVGANFPDKPHLNGIAPGCQIVSVKIGDSRLGSMETGQGLIRGFAHVMKYKYDMINMSYGESATYANTGRICNLARELVEKHNVIFVSSAGNNGPALTTVGAPGGNTENIIGVGAYVSPQMMKDLYIQNSKNPGQPYTWSSRGPTSDGDLGVSVMACGGAITSVPEWTLQGKTLMNGTSMSSPACCGSIALLLSGLKQSNIDYSPIRIRKAIENTALVLPGIERFAQGNGLIQVLDSFNHLLKYKDNKEEDIYYKVRVNHNKRGVYVREHRSLYSASNHSISIQPTWKNLTSDDESCLNDISPSDRVGEHTREKVNFEQVINLSVLIDNTNDNKDNINYDWLNIPEQLILTSAGRSFVIKIDPRNLSPGIYFAFVLGHDANDFEHGPVFRVPVTICIPEYPYETKQIKNIDNNKPNLLHLPNKMNYIINDLPLVSSYINRKFISVPSDATWVEIKLIPKLQDPNDVHASAYLHAVQLVPTKMDRDIGQQKMCAMQHCKTVMFRMAVTGGYTLELCLAQYWSSAYQGSVTMNITFRGIKMDRTVLSLSNDEITRFTLSSLVSEERLAPKIKLDTLRQLKKPVTYSIRSLGERDVIDNNRNIYEMMLMYEWECKKTDKVICRVPYLNNVLYDSDYGSQLWMLYDNNKRLVGTGDCWPEKVDVTTGKYVLMLYIRHEDRNKLTPLQDMTVYFDTSIDNININTSRTFTDAVTSTNTFSEIIMPIGSKISLFTCPVDKKKFPKKLSSSDILVGKAVLESKEKDSVPCPESIPVEMRVYECGYSSKKVCPLFGKKETEKETEKDNNKNDDNKNDDNKNDDNKNDDEDDIIASWEDDYRDMKIKYILDIKDSIKALTAFNHIYPELIQLYPNHLPLLQLRMRVLYNNQKNGDNIDEILSSCEDIIAKVDLIQLAAHFFQKDISETDKKFKKLRDGKNKIRVILVDALLTKLSVLKLKINSMKEKNENINNVIDAYDSTLSILNNWVEESKLKKTEKSSYHSLCRWFDCEKKLYASALKNIRDEISKNTATKELLNEEINILELLGGGFLKYSELIRKWLVVYYPEQYERH